MGGEAQLIHLSFLDANPNPEIIAVDQQEGKVNYFTGNDPKKWKSNIPTYKAVIYKEVYPGIDVKFYGNNRQMEYDIVVKAGADPSKVRLVYEGIKGIKVTEEGNLETSLKEGKIIQKKPVIYQEIDGNLVEVNGKFKIQDSKQEEVDTKESFIYGFELTYYDKEFPLIIDPTLIYSTYIGGSDLDVGNDIALDTYSNVYVVGEARSIDFPTADMGYDVIYNGGSYDAYVIKLNTTGTALSYATFIGGYDEDYGRGIAVDNSGNAYVTGMTRSWNFPTTAGAYDTIPSVGDPFVVKLNPNGDFLTYSTFLGAVDWADTADIALDFSNNAYIVGRASGNFLTTPGAYDRFHNGGSYDLYIVKLNALGSNISYATYLGGNGQEGWIASIAVDLSGNAYVTGFTSSTNFPVTLGAYDSVYNGGVYDGFIVKLNSTGSALTYSTFLGGSNNDYIFDIAVDASSNAYVIGGTSSSDFPTTNEAYNIASNDAIFVAKLNLSGSSLLYSTLLGGSYSDAPRGITIDASGNAYITGSTQSFDFPTTLGAYDTTYNNGTDSFIAKITADGSTIAYSTFIGGSSTDFAEKIALDSMGNAYMVGSTTSADFPTTGGIYDNTYNGSFDIFVLKFIFPPAELTRTGQTTCYDSAGTVIACTGTGQDGEIQAGVVWPNPRFTVNGDATVADNLTGLMWTQDGNAPGPAECSPATTKTWQGALDYVACLNSNSYLGYTDWRLPNNNELMSLVNRGQANTAIRLNTQGFNNVQSGGYWSSTSYAYFPNRVWFVDMWFGYTAFSFKSGNYAFVWPVRSGQAGSFGSSIISLPRTGQTTCYDSAGAMIPCAGTGQDGEIQAGVSWPNPRFTDNNNGTVTDNLTGLIWTQDGNAPGPSTCFPTTAKTWQGALDYVTCLNTNSYLGYTDWRLPNINELISVVNRGQADTASWLNAQGFNNVQAFSYWTATSATSYAWYVSLWSSVVEGTSKSYGGLYVWPVRGGQVGVSPCMPNNYFQDADGDTYGNSSVTTQACTQPAGYVSNSSDCNDSNASINPGAVEVCNGVDDNCNSQIDEGVLNTYYQDADSDTFGNASMTTLACTAPSGYTSDNTDCNDSNASINPGAAEVCNGVDDNCNSQIDEGVLNTYYQDVDGDMYGNASVSTQACSVLIGYTSDNTDCNDTSASINPGAVEVCNGVDDNCNSQIDEGVLNTYFQDSDSDTFGNASVTTLACTAPSGYVSDNTDCNDSSASINPGAVEACNGVDDNCNSQIDEGVQNTYYQDADSDTYGNAAVTTLSCIAPIGYVPDSTDCNDNNAAINPAAAEVCGNGLDDNCNTQIDEGCNLSADLSITNADSSDPVTPAGQNVTYTITVTNNGPAYATNVTVTDVLDTSLTLVSATPSQGAPCTGTGTITCNLGNMISGASATVTVVATTSTTPGMIGSTASVSATEPDPVTANSNAMQTTNVGDVSRQVGISTRGYVETGTNIMVGGFSFGGTVSKKVLIRGRGPSMSGPPYNFTGTLTDPILEIYSGQTLIAIVDDWGGPITCLAIGCSPIDELIQRQLDPCQPLLGQTTAPIGCEKEAAILITLSPGAYTAKLKGVNNEVGKGIIEVYDADTTSLTMLGGISTRGKVLTGTDVMVGGFIVGAGSTNKTLLLRGRGPSLSGAPYNFTGTLTNPTLEIYSGPTLFATVDDWQDGATMCNAPAISCGTPAQLETALVDPCQPNAGQITAPPGCTQESAMFITLPPGAYTAKLKGVNNDTGTGIFEVYEINP